MNVILALTIVVLSAVALFWRGRSGQSLSDTWIPGVGLIVHGAIVLLVVALLSGCTQPPPPAAAVWDSQPTPAANSGWSKWTYKPSNQEAFRP